MTTEQFLRLEEELNRLNKTHIFNFSKLLDKAIDEVRKYNKEAAQSLEDEDKQEINKDNKLQVNAIQRYLELSKNN